MNERRLKIDENTVVHCRTAELANSVLTIADEAGYEWNGGFDLISPRTCKEKGRGYYHFCTDGTVTKGGKWSSKGKNIISAEDFIKLHNNEANQKDPVVYYIRGVEDNGEEVIKMLEAKGGKNIYNRKGNIKSCIYYINLHNSITVTTEESELGMNIITFGTEIFIQEKSNKSNKSNKHEFKPFDRVLVRDYDYNPWSCEIFSTIDLMDNFPYYCIGDRYKLCIPYEGNEHLLGTTNSPTIVK